MEDGEECAVCVFVCVEVSSLVGGDEIKKMNRPRPILSHNPTLPIALSNKTHPPHSEGRVCVRAVQVWWRLPRRALGGKDMITNAHSHPG